MVWGRRRANAAMVSSIPARRVRIMRCAVLGVLLSSSGFAADLTITFHRNIAPILLEYCAPCHRAGQSGPFSLLTFEDARKRAGQIAAVTRRRYMPPWLPES